MIKQGKANNKYLQHPTKKDNSGKTKKTFRRISIRRKQHYAFTSQAKKTFNIHKWYKITGRYYIYIQQHVKDTPPSKRLLSKRIWNLTRCHLSFRQDVVMVVTVQWTGQIFFPQLIVARVAAMPHIGGMRLFSCLIVLNSTGTLKLVFFSISHWTPIVIYLSSNPRSVKISETI